MLPLMSLFEKASADASALKPPAPADSIDANSPGARIGIGIDMGIDMLALYVQYKGN